MHEILNHWNLRPQLLDLFTDHRDGLAALALLANAGAKDWPDHAGDPQLYVYKAHLVEQACQAARPDRSWVHVHEGQPVYFIETSLLLDGEPLQIAFHFREGDVLPKLPDWLTANGRGWRGQAAQGRAYEIACSYLARRGVLMAAFT